MGSHNTKFYSWFRWWIPKPTSLGPLIPNRRLITAWFVLGFVLNGETETTQTEQLIGIGGLFLISITTMIEAKIAQKKAIDAIE
tara:strand:+ start:891 stop:1142 length:252 start_codon:yes stop_codon:yes gene_type:complete